MRPITLLLPATCAVRDSFRLEDLRSTLREIVQMAVAAPVTLAVVPAALIPQLLEGAREAVAWAPPLVARDLVRLRLASPIAVADTGADYASALVAGADVESLADIAHQRVGWVSKVSATGYLIPRLYLESFGLEVSTLFSSERFYGSHDAVARALAAGEIDVAATHSGRLLGVMSASRARILTSIGPVPADLLLASTTLSVSVRLAVTQALLSSGLGPFRFRAPRPGHLDLFDLLRSEPASMRTLPRESGVAVC
jgi:ABC-type phosphate/phosphonate transport system substrate-binding protein